MRGIGLLESIHKIISKIIDLRMAKAVKYSESIHGFRNKRGTYTAIGETKLRMKIFTSASVPLFQIFLDLKKAYDSVDRRFIMKILKKYDLEITKICSQTKWRI